MFWLPVMANAWMPCALIYNGRHLVDQMRRHLMGFEFYFTIAQSFRSLRKFSEIQRSSDSDIPPAKTQRRQVQRKKINILPKDFHHLSPTFAALATLREILRVSVAAVPR
jgi:hypothetical protein